MARVHLRHRVAVLDRARLRVQDDTNSYDVDIESGYCSCERPSLEGIICRHVWCVLLSNVDGGDAMRNNRLSLFAPKGGLKGELERLYEGQWVAAYIHSTVDQKLGKLEGERFVAGARTALARTASRAKRCRAATCAPQRTVHSVKR